MDTFWRPRWKDSRARLPSEKAKGRPAGREIGGTHLFDYYYRKEQRKRPFAAAQKSQKEQSRAGGQMSFTQQVARVAATLSSSLSRLAPLLLFCCSSASLLLLLFQLVRRLSTDSPPLLFWLPRLPELRSRPFGRLARLQTSTRRSISIGARRSPTWPLESSPKRGKRARRILSLGCVRRANHCISISISIRISARTSYRPFSVLVSCFLRLTWLDANSEKLQTGKNPTSSRFEKSNIFELRNPQFSTVLDSSRQVSILQIGACKSCPASPSLEPVLVLSQRQS